MRRGSPFRWLTQLITQPGLFRGLIGMAVGGVLVAVIYTILRLVAGQSLDTAKGAILVFTAIGFAFGFVWGMGGAAPGASAHEGPAEYMREHPSEQKGFLAFGREETMKFFKWAIPKVIPLLRPLGFAIVIAAVVIGIVLFVAANPIVPLGNKQTSDAAANAAQITGDKLLYFGIFLVIVFGSLAVFAIGLALLFTSVNRQVEVSKKAKVTPLPNSSPLMQLWHYLQRLGLFFAEWVSDYLSEFTKTVSR